MKKIIALLLAVVIAVVPISAVAEGTPNAIIEKLAFYTPQMRAQYIAMLRPFLTSDAGVAAGIDNIKSGMFESMLGVTFTAAQEDMLVRTFRSLSCIGEDTGIRLKYADILQNKVPADISAATEAGMKKLIKAISQRYPLIGKIITEDGYSEAVVANMLKVIPEINSSALVTFEKGEFSVREVNTAFSSEFDAVWAGFTDEKGKTITAYNMAEMIAAVFNLVPDDDRMITAKALESLGVCKFKGDGTVPPTATAADTQHYTVVTHISGVSNTVFDGSVVIKTKSDIPETIEVLVTSDNPMIYKLVGSSVLQPVKYSIPTDKGIIANVEPDTVYVIRTAVYPFADADGWGKSYIAALNARGIINGKSEFEFMPDAAITREEFIKLVVELFDLLDENAVCEFVDVPENAWFAKYVASAHAAGITDGIGGGKFGTGAPIKRQDMAKIINTILMSKGIGLTGTMDKFADDATIADYAKSHVYAISGHIISGDDTGNFHPLKNATRQEAAKMVFGMLKLCIS